MKWEEGEDDKRGTNRIAAVTCSAYIIGAACSA